MSKVIEIESIGELGEELGASSEERLLDSLPEDVIRRILRELTIDNLGSVLNVSSIFYHNANVILADYAKTIGYDVDTDERKPSVFIQVKSHIKDLQKFAAWITAEMTDPQADIISIVNSKSPSISEIGLLYKFLQGRIKSYAKAIDYNIERFLDCPAYPPVTMVMIYVNSLLDMRERYLANQDEKDLVPKHIITINNESPSVEDIWSLKRWLDRMGYEDYQKAPKCSLAA